MKLVSSNAPLNVLFPPHRRLGAIDLGECILNRLGAGKFRQLQRRPPTARDHQSPYSRGVRKSNFDVSQLRSKFWGSNPGAAPKLGFVVTVCNDAAKKVCPIWPASP